MGIARRGEPVGIFVGECLVQIFMARHFNVIVRKSRRGVSKFDVTALSLVS